VTFVFPACRPFFPLFLPRNFPDIPTELSGRKNVSGCFFDPFLLFVTDSSEISTFLVQKRYPLEHGTVVKPGKHFNPSVSLLFLWKPSDTATYAGTLW